MPTRHCITIGLLLLLGWSVPAIAAPAARTATTPQAERLKALEQQAAQSRARAAELAQRTAQMQKELAAQRQNLTKQAADVRTGEETLSKLEDEQTVLSGRLSDQSELLGAARAKLARLTEGLARLARIPPGGLFVAPEAPIDAARAQMLLASAVAATREAGEQAEHELARLDDVSRELDAKQREAERAASSLKARQTDLAALVERRQALYQDTDSDRKAEEERARKIADEAQDLRDLVARIEAEQKAEAAREAEERRKAAAAALKLKLARPPPEKPASPPVLQGRFVGAKGFPVAGQIKIRFGQNDGLGTTSHGVTLSARPGATVTAPAAGVVRFAGPFRGYREILILEHPGGYLSLIAGMTRINAALGTSVGVGEPVGTMDERPEAKPELYYELRRNGQPVDPEAASLPGDVKGKVR